MKNIKEIKIKNELVALFSQVYLEAHVYVTRSNKRVDNIRKPSIHCNEQSRSIELRDEYLLIQE